MSSLSGVLGSYLPPTHFLYPKTEMMLLSSNLSYLSTCWLTTAPALHGALFIMTTSMVSFVVDPLIRHWLKSHQDLNSLNKTSKLLNFAISSLAAKSICYLVGCPLTLFQTVQVAVAFFVSVVALKLLLRKTSQFIRKEFTFTDDEQPIG